MHRRYDCVMVYNDAAPDWTGWAIPWITVHNDPRFKWDEWVAEAPGRRRLVITQGLIPSNLPKDWRARGARGEYERHARKLARTLVAAGLGDSVIRLGHEANGTWYHHSVGDTPRQWAQWRRFWARTVRAMRSQPGADFVFDWTVNAGYRPIPLEAWYPGDDVVDIVGIDLYDHTASPSIHARPGGRRWSDQVNQPGSLSAVTAFARRHGKPISIPEWGLAKPGEWRGGMGDNPDFVRRIARVVRTTPTAYSSYFESPTGDTLQLSRAPRSAAAYRALFRRS